METSQGCYSTGYDHINISLYKGARKHCYAVDWALNLPEKNHRISVLVNPSKCRDERQEGRTASSLFTAGEPKEYKGGDCRVKDVELFCQILTADVVAAGTEITCHVGEKEM